MKKIVATLVLAAACVSAFGQGFSEFKDSDWGFENEKWDLGFQLGFMYNYTFDAPAGMSNSGFGMDLSVVEMRWKGWKGGSLTLGIIDILMDWQYLQKGNRFDSSDLVPAGTIIPNTIGKGNRFNVNFGFPIGINQQFGEKFGISLAAVPGVGIYSYNNDYDNGMHHIEETFYPKSNRVHFQLDVKAGIWYSDFGIIVRYSPLKAKDINTTILSVGIAFRD